MKRVYAVIGANFGDEGKGYTVNKLCERFPYDNTLVIRTNGGSQAGHTVEIQEYESGSTSNLKLMTKKHIFHHFGSGTLSGADTYLSKEFIVNPIAFRQEYEELKAKTNLYIKTYVDKRARVTTPYDMIINQALETIRDKDRHGSCGLGINETIVRNDNYDFKMTVVPKTNLEFIYDRTKLIRDKYIPLRLKELGIYDKIDDRTAMYLIDDNDNILDRYMEDYEYMISKMTIIAPEVANIYDNIIFEQAQGLLLDKDSKYFPHVTPTKTGLKYVMDYLQYIKYTGDLEVLYVTRPYITRHGAGELENELKNKPYSNIADETNIPNEWQGSLRFALPDEKEIAFNIDKDIQDNTTSGINIKANLSVTCIKHLDNPHEVKTVRGTVSTHDFIKNIVTSSKYLRRGYDKKVEHLLDSYIL